MSCARRHCTTGLRSRRLIGISAAPASKCSVVYVFALLAPMDCDLRSQPPVVRGPPIYSERCGDETRPGQRAPARIRAGSPRSQPLSRRRHRHGGRRSTPQARRDQPRRSVLRTG
jgi:hypothetical protein